MICKNCKNELPDELHFTFCGYCGERLIRERKKKNEIKVPKPRQRGKRWYLELRKEGVTVIEDTEAEAIAKAQAIRAGFIEASPKLRGATVLDAVTEYIESRSAVLSPSTIRGYNTIKRQRFTDTLMTRKISTLTEKTVQDDVNAELLKGISAKTLNDAFSLIRKACLTKDKKLTVFEGIALPQVQPNIPVMLTIEQLGVLINSLHESPCELPLLIALWLGLRRSEIFALEKSDFDFNAKTITVHAALVPNTENKYTKKGTKTAASVRVFSCPDYILDKVKELPEGRIYNHGHDYMSRCLHKLCEAHGLPLIRVHDLRHLNASIMLLLNIQDKYSMERGGWSSKKTMKGRYQHTFDSEKQAVDKQINDYFKNLLTNNITSNSTTGVEKP